MEACLISQPAGSPSSCKEEDEEEGDIPEELAVMETVGGTEVSGRLEGAGRSREEEVWARGELRGGGAIRGMTTGDDAAAGLGGYPNNNKGYDNMVMIITRNTILCGNDHQHYMVSLPEVVLLEQAWTRTARMWSLP